MNILNVGYGSTNYYVTGKNHGRLLIDVGWPGTLGKLRHGLDRQGVDLAEIKHLVVTHYHPDHAGLAQEVVDQGIRLVVLTSQLASVPRLGRYIKPSYGYREIALDNAIPLSPGESRHFLERMGIAGEIIATPGHSEDSVAVILDEGQAFTGDLPHLNYATEEAKAQVEQSWADIRRLGAKTIYPGHGPIRPLDTES